jgi:hypothetical protein
MKFRLVQNGDKDYGELANALEQFFSQLGAALSSGVEFRFGFHGTGFKVQVSGLGVGGLLFTFEGLLG